MQSVLFVCLGNICRSPVAEALYREFCLRKGVEFDDRLIDSAGTGDWHIGSEPDPRSVRILKQRGIETNHRARQLTASDFNQFDLVIAMDENNLADISRWPGADPGRVKLFTDYMSDPTGNPSQLRGIPDPYYGTDSGFEAMANLITLGLPGIYAAASSGENAADRGPN